MIIPGMVFRHKINEITLIVIDVDPEQIHALTKDCKGIRHNMLAKDLLEFYTQLDDYDFDLIPSGVVFLFHGITFQKIYKVRRQGRSQGEAHES